MFTESDDTARRVMIQGYQGDYRIVLRNQLAERARANPKYSLRAFARDLGVGHARLSLVLNGLRGLSESAANGIAKKLSLSPVEKVYFVNLVLAQDSRSKAKRLVAQGKIAAQSGPLPVAHFPTLEEDAFKVIGSWYHFALMELTTLRGFKSDSNWIARKLGITRYETEAAVHRLIRLGLLSKTRNGRIYQTQENLQTTNEVPSDTIKDFHRQVLSKAFEAIGSQGIDEREMTNLSVAIDSKRLPEFKKKIKEFVADFNQLAESQKSGRDEVYSLSTLFFRITRKGEPV